MAREYTYHLALARVVTAEAYLRWERPSLRCSRLLCDAMVLGTTALNFADMPHPTVTRSPRDC